MKRNEWLVSDDSNSHPSKSYFFSSHFSVPLILLNSLTILLLLLMGWSYMAQHVLKYLDFGVVEEISGALNQSILERKENFSKWIHFSEDKDLLNCLPCFMEPNINQYRVGNCKAMEFSKIIFSKYLDKNITILSCALMILNC